MRVSLRSLPRTRSRPPATAVSRPGTARPSAPRSGSRSRAPTRRQPRGAATSSASMTPARTHTRPQSTNRGDISPQHRLPISRAHGKLTGDGRAIGGTHAQGCHRRDRHGAARRGHGSGRAGRSDVRQRPLAGRLRHQDSANWVNHELWVETTMDTDFDGRLDRVHVDVSRPMETETDGLKVPVIYEDSPYYAGGADVTNWAVDHEIGVPPATRPRAPFFTAGNTSPTISTHLREHVGAARLRRRALRVARAPATRTAARTPARRSRPRAPRRSSTGSTAAPRATRRGPATSR